MSALDLWIAACLIPLAVWLLISGLDDLFVDLVCLLNWPGRRARGSAAAGRPSDQDLDSAPCRRIAVFIPLWREHRVIGKMLERNLKASRYEHYDVFIGCYPNDQPTVAAVREAEARFARVHLALCPHGGPTSKADCLNWIYQRMLAYEQEHSLRFEVVVTHDAEDLMHPDELRWINYYAERYDMVQIPVLPLPTPPGKFTHGVYCDEFAEYQSKDVPVRVQLGAFLPSNGVGTGYSRSALERLAACQPGQLFDPGALTEDYVIGLRLHRLGCTQLFVPIHFQDGSPMATREYFPQDLRAAVRQRTRWVLGIALQCWEQLGWRGGLPQIYFFWRDRKGLLGNPLTALVNVIFLYGVLTLLWSRLSGEAWGFAQALHGFWALGATLALQLWRMGVRAVCVARIYGWRFALWTPLRLLWANWINFAATAAALRRYALSRWQKRPLAWLKTEHTYPVRPALAGRRTPLGELLVRSRLLSQTELAEALAAKPARLRLGEYLVRSRRLTESEIYMALSLQQDLPLEQLRPPQVPRQVARALPAALVRRWKVLPFKVAYGNLFIASPELPSEAVEAELRRFTRLEIRFHLLTPGNFEQLQRGLIESHSGPQGD